MAELRNLLKQLRIDASFLSEQDLQLIEAGVPVSESEDEFSESAWDPRHTPHRTHDALRDDYERNIKDLTARLRELQRQKNLLEDSLEVQRSEFKKEQRGLKETHSLELESLKTANKRLKQEAPLLRQRADELKDELRNLQISEELYCELKGVPEDSRNLREWVLVKVHELLQGYQRANGHLKKDLDEHKVANSTLSEQLTSTQRELAHREAHTGSYVKDLERKHDDLAKENQRVHSALDHFKQLASENSDKVLRFTEVAGDLKHFQEETARLNSLVQGQLTQLSVLTQSAADHKSQFETTRKENEILAHDKSYLSKQNAQLQDKLQRLEDRNDRLELEIVESKNSAQNYLNKLLDSTAARSSETHQALTRELSEIRERHTQELEQLKNNLTEVHERRVEFLKEAKEQTDLRALKLEQGAKDTTEAYELLLIEHRNMQSRLDQLMHELRSELRLKTDQLDRSNNIYEDTVGALRHSKAENSMLKDKLDLLQQEIYKTDSRAIQENAEVKAKLAVAQENLAQYALIEQELDDAIRNNDGAGLQAPTTAKRRVQQSLELAKQLKDKSAQAAALSAENVRLLSEVQQLESELALAKKLLSSTEQPYSYLVAQVEGKEREVIGLKQQLARLNQQYLDVAAQQEVLLNKNKELQSDMQHILTKRDAIESLKDMMGRLVDEQDTKKTVKAKDTAPAWFNTLKKQLNK